MDFMCQYEETKSIAKQSQWGVKVQLTGKTAVTADHAVSTCTSPAPVKQQLQDRYQNIMKQKYDEHNDKTKNYSAFETPEVTVHRDWGAGNADVQS